MNWTSRIRKLLGRFWTVAFGDHDFILGVEKYLSLLYKSSSHKYDQWAAGNIAADKSISGEPMPFAVYLLKAKLTTTSGTTAFTSCIEHPAYTVDDIVTGGQELGSVNESGGYMMKPRDPMPETAFITDHVIDYTKTLVRNMDYTVDNGYVLFYVDPTTLGFKEVTLTDDDGNVCIYYRVFGWLQPQESYKDAVCGFTDDALNSAADIAWEMHTKGATVMNIKQLLCRLTGAALCEADGNVSSIWLEQGYRCVKVHDRVYSAPSSYAVHVSAGDAVKAGDVLLGDISVCSFRNASQMSSAEVPGMLVSTDAGSLLAQNQSLPAYVSDNVNILPLSGDATVLAAYRAKCLALAADTSCVKIDVPSTVNPFRFVMETLRKSHALFVSLVARNLDRIAAALSCIRKRMNASAMLTAYVRAESDTVSLSTFTFTARAGNAAVATAATAKIQDMAAEAHIKL